VAPALHRKGEAAAAAPSESPPNQVNTMNALELVSANVLNFVIFMVTLFGRFVGIVRILY
jgi:hypothetical protein